MNKPSDQQALESVVQVDITNEGDLRNWAKKLDVSPQQVRDAVEAVGTSAGDVEMHLKGSRASSNASKEKAGEQIAEKR